MISVSYKTISITRGDTGLLNFSINGYTLEEDDTVVLTVKKTVNDTVNVFQKTLDLETMQFKIEPTDTSGLSYGMYVYDVQLTTNTGEVYTVVTPHSFIIQDEVTF